MQNPFYLDIETANITTMFFDHIQGSDTTCLWECRTCGQKWAAAHVLPCSQCHPDLYSLRGSETVYERERLIKILESVFTIEGSVLAKTINAIISEVDHPESQGKALKSAGVILKS